MPDTSLPPLDENQLPPKKPRSHPWLWASMVLLLLIAALVAAYELIASPFQAMVLAGYGKRLTFQSEAGENTGLRTPAAGPYDLRLGYVGLPEFIRRLKTQGYEVTQQARISSDMARIDDFGLFIPYKEKSVAGLSLLDCRGETMYDSPHPRYTYPDFNAVPAVIANTLLFIENRELLDPNHPQRNPAIEWDRLAQAVLERGLKAIDPKRNVPGGSTLATQIEKYRHSPDGLTMTANDKLRQMASASLRAYLDGEDTRDNRRRIVLDYLNTVPLAAAPGFGEVNGVGDGLQAWFGLDFDQVNLLLKTPYTSPEAARAFKHVLGLLISQRKPSYYLLVGREKLNAIVDAHLRLLAEANIISTTFRDAAIRERILFKDNKALKRAAIASNNKQQGNIFVENKAANSMRIELSSRIGVQRLYDLDRLDVSISTTLHAPTQRAVSTFLRHLSDPAAVESAALFGQYLLSPDNDLAKPIYSFTLYENTEDGAMLRVQADNLNQPFDINKGAKLDMGSSAKLRTLITYLQLVSELHEQYYRKSPADLHKLKIAEKDLLMQWVVNYLANAPDKSLAPMLEAAMARSYSASPGESFFTGGGLHHFSNFHHDDDLKVMDLWEATRNSVNLPFIRLMRDIVRHFIYRDSKGAAQILADSDDPRRSVYLKQFADKEGKSYLARFIKKYKGLKQEESTAALLNHLTSNPKRLAAVYRYLDPKANITAFTQFIKSRTNSPSTLTEGDFEYLFETYGPEKFDLSDRGYITQIHPLELWLVGYLRLHPAAGWSEIVDASANHRIDVYNWLLNTSHKNAQDSRILSRLEIEAFQEVHKRWRRLGYPFGSLVPSYATAIGSSADRPAALAELMGVITNDGVKLDSVTLTRIEFATGTPYHTILKRKRAAGEYIFPASIAHVVKRALANVVEQGTARRLRGTYKSRDGTLMPIGGKTGTGDHRLEVYAANGAVIESKVMNRTATFAFYMGSRFFGVMTVFVPGEAAAKFHFTSAIAVQIVKDMEPALRPLVLSEEQMEPSWEELAAAFDAEAGVKTGERPKEKVVPKPVPVIVIKPKPKPTIVEPADLPPAPPPPQVDKPDPLPPSAAQTKNSAPTVISVPEWDAKVGEGHNFFIR